MDYYEKVVNAIQEIKKIGMQTICKEVISFKTGGSTVQEMNIVKVSKKYGLSISAIVDIVQDLAVSGLSCGLYEEKNN
ncbi:MAG: hypothetical protein M0P12_00125 [Paludibacteraceae bacterium]|jgi:hypothetical protein|nr:hypothetical protein [Paludibacteraceae bacterium]MCK9615745.1 hypothetical protein [Candidatus Omnitrophota bacterium]